MPQRKKKICLSNYKNSIVCSILSVLLSHSSLISSETPSMMLDKENLVLDQSTICAEWYRLWPSFGFSEHQWSSHAAKVEEYAQVRIFLALIEYSHWIS